MARGEQAAPVEPRPRGRPRGEPAPEAQRHRGRPRLAAPPAQELSTEAAPYDPRAELCGGSARAFSTLLRQTEMRRQPSRRQRPAQRPEEAGGEGGGSFPGST